MDLKDIPAGTYLTPFVVEAAPDAPLGASLVEFKGEALTPGKDLRRIRAGGRPDSRPWRRQLPVGNG